EWGSVHRRDLRSTDSESLGRDGGNRACRRHWGCGKWRRRRAGIAGAIERTPATRNRRSEQSLHIRGVWIPYPEVERRRHEQHGRRDWAPWIWRRWGTTCGCGAERFGRRLGIRPGWEPVHSRFG